jgi:hypothetical protein
LTMFIRWHLSKSYMLGLAVTPIWSGSFSSLSKFAQTYLKLAGPTAQCCTALACVVRGVRCVVCVCVCACVCVCVCVCVCECVCWINPKIPIYWSKFVVITTTMYQSAVLTDR